MFHPLNNSYKIHKESYKSYNYKSTHLSLTCLNFAIVSHSNDWFIKCFGSIYKGEQCLNAETIGTKFTPLHFCAISGNLEAAKELLLAGADPDRQDCKGWTPLHHAALSSHNEMIRLFMEYRANPSIKNMHGGTYEDILNLIDPPRNLSHLRWIDESQNLHPMTEELFLEKTNAHYVSNCKIDRDHLLEQEKGDFSLPIPLVELIREQEHHAQRPLLALGHATKDSEGNLLKNSCGLGLFAAEEIASMTILGEYCGQIEKSPKKNPYLLRKVNAEPFRNEMAQINDGFPNCVCIDIPNSNGLKARYLMIAARTLRKGEQILWNYGNHKVKSFQYNEIAGSEARIYVRKINSWHFSLLSMQTRYVYLFENYVEFTNLCYLLNTPSVLFKAGFESSRNRKNIKELIRLGCAQNIIPLNMHEVMGKMGKAIKQAQNDLAEMQSDYPKTYREYRNLLLNRMMGKGIESVINIALHYGFTLKDHLSERAKVREKSITDIVVAASIASLEL